MKFKFKIQQYQTDAVEQTVDVFSGQPSKTETKYLRSLGKTDGKITYEEANILFLIYNLPISLAQTTKVFRFCL